MSRSRARFTQSDIFRVLKASRQARCSVRVEIEQSTGKIVIITKPTEPPTDEGSSSWDEAIADLEAR